MRRRDIRAQRRAKEQGRTAFSDFLADVLRAEEAGEDLQDGGHCVHVCAKRPDGSLYELGHVDASAAYQDPEGAKMAIERIKFSRREHGG